MVNRGRARVPAVGTVSFMMTAETPQISPSAAVALLSLTWIVTTKPPVVSPALVAALEGDDATLVSRLRHLSASQMKELKTELHRLSEARVCNGPLRFAEMSAALDSLTRRSKRSPNLDTLNSRAKNKKVT